MKRLLQLAALCLLSIPAWGQCSTNATGIGGAWTNVAFSSAQSGTFETTFTGTPDTNTTNAVIQLSTGNSDDFNDGSAQIRFNPASGRIIEARNAGAYAASNTVNWTQALVYTFRLTVDFLAETYNAWVDSGAGEVQIATNYAFRSDWTGSMQLDTWALHADAGSVEVCSPSITGDGNQQTPGPLQTQGPVQSPGDVQSPGPVQEIF